MATLEPNKTIVKDFYETAFRGNPDKAVADHMGDRYIQHNPQAQDGPAAFIGFVNYLHAGYPELQLHIKQVIAEGDLVITRSHLILTPGQPGQALADFFRLDHGKIVEHWDVVQDVPDTSVNTNGMF